MTADDVLDNPAWSSLTGPHADFAEGDDLARRYAPDVSPYHAVRSWEDPGVWDSLLALAGPRAELFFSGAVEPEVPPFWEKLWAGSGNQMVETAGLKAQPFDEAIVLGLEDAPEMLALVDLTEPGPFRERTVLMGRYVGVRRDGKLVAMAGERLHAEGWTEISAVCTDPGYRGQGLASRLVLDVTYAIQQRGDRAFLHTTPDNDTAVKVYEGIGFEMRAHPIWCGLKTPDADDTGYAR